MDIKNIGKVTRLLAEWHECRLFLANFEKHVSHENIVINELKYTPPFRNEVSENIIPEINKAVEDIFENKKKEIEKILKTL